MSDHDLPHPPRTGLAKWLVLLVYPLGFLAVWLQHPGTPFAYGFGGFLLLALVASFAIGKRRTRLLRRDLPTVVEAFHDGALSRVDEHLKRLEQRWGEQG